MRHQKTIPPVRVASLALLAAALVLGCNRGTQPSMVNQVAPDFTVQDGGRAVTLSHLRGRVVLVNFWASWCQPCVEELPSLIALHQQMPQLEILAVSLDHDAGEYSAFLAKHPLPFDLVRDPTEASARLYGTDGYPETFIVDSAGVVRRHFVGPEDWTSPLILNYLQSVK